MWERSATTTRRRGTLRVRTVAIVNMKGGVAKTTLAVNLADYLVRSARKNVLLVDLDPQFNATQCLFTPAQYAARRAKGEHTITTIFDDTPHSPISPVSGVSRVEPVALQAIKPWRYKDRYHVVPGDLELYRLDMAAGQGREHRLRRFIEAYADASRIDYVVIDTPPTPSHWLTSGLLAADYYLVPVRPEPLSRTGIDLLRGVINRCSTNYGHTIECAGVVLTVVDRRTTVYNDAVRVLNNDPFWKDKKYKADLPQRTTIAWGQGHQRLIMDLNQLSDAKLALAQISNEFLRRVGDE
jgi:chromosome partitioning protein